MQAKAASRGSGIRITTIIGRMGRIIYVAWRRVIPMGVASMP